MEKIIPLRGIRIVLLIEHVDCVE